MLPLVGEIESGNHAQHGCLAAAGGAEQREELTGFDVDADLVDRVKVPKRRVTF